MRAAPPASRQFRVQFCFAVDFQVSQFQFTVQVSCWALFISCSRRVVAVGADPHSTAASEVMTPNPTTVLTEDSAMEALGIMLGRHFRHLPVRAQRQNVRRSGVMGWIWLPRAVATSPEM